MIRNQVFKIALVLVLLSCAPIYGGDFDCADPADLGPETADLVVTKEVNVSEVKPGGEIIYTIRVHNCGPSDGIDTEFVDQLPKQVLVTSVEQVSGPTFDISEPPIGVSLISDDALWGASIEVMPVGETAVFEVVVRVLYL